MNVDRFKKRKDFDQRWIELVGGDPPTMRELSEMLEDSIKVRNSTQLIDRDGHRRVIPGIYWNPERQLILEVDVSGKQVIRFFTPSLKRKKKEKNA